MTHSFKGPSVTQVTEPVNHGEGPVWDRRVGKLYFLDIHQGKILAYDYEKDSTEIAAEFSGNDIAPIFLTRNDANIIVAGINRSLSKVRLYDKNAEPSPIHTVQNEKPKNRFNEGKADSRGRIWIGTMGYESADGKIDLNAGALFKFTKDNITNPTIQISKVSISNGLAWNKDGTKLYYIDSPTQEIAEYDYYGETGNISNRRISFDLKGKGMGYPDGMTIDEDDNLWIALYAGGSIIQINPTKKTLLRRIPIPALYVTSVTWGGPELNILFVTTSKRSLTPKERDQQPGAGSVYAVRHLGTKGRPEFEADI